MKFSIIIPSYNRESTIVRAIDSVLRQTYQNFEIIIVDDGSSDNTNFILSNYKNDKRFKLITLSKNSGVNVARNVGIKNVSDDSGWVTFLDSDDEFVEDALQSMKNTIEANPQYNYFRFPVKYFNGTPASNLKLAGTVADYEDYLASFLVCGEWVVTINIEIIRKGFLYDERVKAFESLSWLALSKKEKIYYSDSIVRIYHIDTESISRPISKSKAYFENSIAGCSLILHDFGADLKRINFKAYSTYLFSLGNDNILIGNIRVGLAYTFKAMKVDFLNPRSLRNFRSLILKN